LLKLREPAAVCKLGMKGIVPEGPLFLDAPGEVFWRDAKMARTTAYYD